ncbi:MAG: hypothetical protein KGD74_11825 [Candidatus Lokiarchaeota archaeon]|nr:hypothetical protein [Candidatus Lokiarchaeota archaeon]
MNLKISAWAAIIGAIILIPSCVLGLLLETMPENQTIHVLSIIVTAIGLLVAFLIVLGYVRIAKLNKLKFLEIMMYISLIAAVLFNIYAILTIKSDSMFGLVFLVLLGIIELITGIAIFKLKNVFGGIITAIGVMYIINGIFFASIIFLLLIPLTGIATCILEAIFFFRASKKYD